MWLFFLLSLLGPSGALNLPAIGPFRNFGQRGESSFHIKSYTGRRVKNDSIRMVYFHDQTVAIVELQPDKLLLNCELIEVYQPEDAIKALGDFQHVSRPVAISFKEMTTLMRQCQQVEDGKSVHDELAKNITAHPIAGRGILANNPFVLLSGIIPGTKWCGTGDIAKDYYDLGAEPTVDKCCRAHDLCPVKVRAFSQRYNITNDSLYTKSHCLCDDQLYSCLKENPSPTAHIMGTIYFNLVQIPCLEDTQHGKVFRKPKERF
ncbi:phospholipase A2B precursor [Tribolium castaneum]|uniref:Phospholipase A2 n=1 Tax=Tribolium castaneum TaxID=7070 RepID=C0LTQ2_TRICA|nr:phospholipase A2B precursor [Tribolium castaneum]ACN42748.1 phospholipase A2B [Tribolium castaneum]EFA07968.1 hypothetical protein TcasGA2_TC005550 [Tribolium castaneum]|eukprot:NP_001139390.1 phospholipase A2B precursor [Tribolium castaneum]